ncbi:hypothetical protein, partial [Aliivibrio fischeri]|uniref:hypothetical protein n=1 Tax=Aliivibrio fischeri TaxID=668 RepID=UPI001BE43804
MKWIKTIIKHAIMIVSVFFKKTTMVKLAFLGRSMPAQQHSNSLPSSYQAVHRHVKFLNIYYLQRLLILASSGLKG